jgi:hypothetical protein
MRRRSVCESERDKDKGDDASSVRGARRLTCARDYSEPSTARRSAA